MQHTFKGVAGQLLELFQVCAAENIEDGMVGVEQLLRLLCLVDEKAPGHMPAYFFYHGYRLFI